MVADLLVPLGSTGLVLALLGAERVWVRANQRGIPLRVAVAGTRGKSSVTRLIAAGLAAGGRRVWAKTTGSRAAVILPSGEEHPLVRRGLPSILEQRHIVAMARRAGADALVAEVMSIRPENYAVELGHLLRPHVLALTNVRPDHVADLGGSTARAARTFLRGIPADTHVIYPLHLWPEGTGEVLAQRGCRVTEVGPSAYPHELGELTLPYAEWADNVRLALAVCEAAGVPAALAARGMESVREDFGALRAWRIIEEGREWIAVNAFAANDPVSTLSILHRVQHAPPCRGRPVGGVLNLRADRGDRTAQWSTLLSSGEAPPLDFLLVVGDRPTPLVRRAQRRYKDRVEAVRVREPSDVFRAGRRFARDGGVLFGFGNIGGVGAILVEHWEKVGEPQCLWSSLS